MKGVLPDRKLKELVYNGYISSERGISEEQIQPSSIDLRLGRIAYKIEGEPNPKMSLDDVAVDKFYIDDWTEFSPGITYAVELEERLNPNKINPYIRGIMHIHTNPKSSAGRTGMISKIWAPGSEKLDDIPAEHVGKIYSIITPRAFPIKLKHGVSINQMRISYGRLEKSKLDPKTVYERLLNKGIYFMKNRRKTGIPESKVKFDKGGIEINMYLPEGEPAFYESKPTNKSVIFERKKNKLLDFFEEKFLKNGKTKLENGKFYISATEELIAIPTTDTLQGIDIPPFVIEIMAYDEGSGEFRSHAAGFVEYGFGDDENSLIIMEIHPHSDIVVGKNSPVGLMILYELHEPPETKYEGFYRGQMKLTPGKYFKE